jgi:hypothetical protein
MVVAHKGDHVETFANDVRKMNLEEREAFAKLMRTDGDTLGTLSFLALKGDPRRRLKARLNLGQVMLRQGPRRA